MIDKILTLKLILFYKKLFVQRNANSLIKHIFYLKINQEIKPNIHLFLILYKLK